MIDPVTLFREGGPYMFALLLAAPVAFGVALVGVVLVWIKQRVPAALWFGGVPIFGLVGLMGTFYGYQLTASAAAAASPEIAPVMLASGMSVSLFVEIFGAMLAVMVLVPSCMGLGVASWVADRDGESTAPDAGIVAGIAAVAVGITGVGFVASGAQTVAAMPLVAYVVAAPFVALAASRTASGERAASSVEQRLAAALMLGTVGVLAGWMFWRTGEALVGTAISRASAEMKPTLIAAGEAQVFAARIQTGVFGLATVAMVGALAARSREAIDGRTLASLGVFALGLGVLVLGVLAVFAAAPA